MEKPVPSPAPPSGSEEAVRPAYTHPADIIRAPSPALSYHTPTGSSPTAMALLANTESMRLPSADFICISEFAEQVGPVPLLVHPREGAGTFNLSSFVVRIMATDYQKKNSDFGEFAEDSQVIMPEPSENAIAYVHHLTLLDIYARGFVRPICISYITNEKEKIMENVKWIRDQFSLISMMLKRGNQRLFLADIRSRLSQVDTTVFDLPHGDSEGEEGWADATDVEDAAEAGEDTPAEGKTPLALLRELMQATEAALNCPLDVKKQDSSAIAKLVLLLSGASDVSGGSPFQSDSAAQAPETQASKEAKIIATLHKARNFDEELRPLHGLCGADFETAITQIRELYAILSRPAPVLAIEKEEHVICNPSSSMLDLGGIPIVNMAPTFYDAQPATPFFTDCESFAASLWKWPMFSPRGILDTRHQYSSFIKHMAFSLLKGRPLVVLGGPQHEKRISALIEGLSMFVPNASEDSVVPWRTAGWRMSDCRVMKLWGQCKQQSGAPISKAMERYVSILDYEHSYYQGPSYDGEILASLFSPRRNFPSDEAFAAFIHEKLLEAAHNAMILHYVSCEKSLSSSSVTDLEQRVKKLAASFDWAPSDLEIFSNLSKVVQESQMKKVAGAQGFVTAFHLDYCSPTAFKLNSK